MDVTVVLLTCLYKDQEFIRIGYYVHNEYTEEINENTIIKPENIRRNILADKPRVTRFNITWDNDDKCNKENKFTPLQKKDVNDQQQENDEMKDNDEQYYDEEEEEDDEDEEDEIDLEEDIEEDLDQTEDDDNNNNNNNKNMNIGQQENDDNDTHDDDEDIDMQ